MRLTWINKGARSGRLILIFPGWGTQPSFYSDLSRSVWDLCVVEDYSDFDFPMQELSDYSTIYLYAWSLGVAMAPRVLKEGDVTAAFAINGTEEPVSSEYGIPERIFKGTREGLSDLNLRKFRRRMVDSPRAFTDLLQKLETQHDDIERLRKELLTFESLPDVPVAHRLKWNRAYLPETDNIIPVAAQKKYWATRPDVPVTMLRGCHLPDFYAILNVTIPDLRSVGSHFHAALRSYDSQASAQQRIASRLSEMIAEAEMPPGGHALEIGQGSGLFTRMYAPLLRPSKIEYVDLYATAPFGAAPEEIFHIADAEQWIEEEEGTLRDYILSSSSLQWFVNPLRFFGFVRDVLAPSGLFAFSTFLPGNLRELDTLRPTPLTYPDAGILKRGLEKLFRKVRTEEEEIVLEFDSVREALLHLRDTGVKGGLKISRDSVKISEALHDSVTGKYRLTYKAFYAVCIK